MAKKVHRTLPVAVLHLAIRRTHSTEGLNPALDTLRHPGTLARAHFTKRMLPRWLQAASSNVECLLLRDHANPHLPICIDCKGFHPTTAKIDGVAMGQVSLILHVAFRQSSVFAQTLRSLQIQRHHFFRKKLHSQRTLLA